MSFAGGVPPGGGDGAGHVCLVACPVGVKLRRYLNIAAAGAVPNMRLLLVMILVHAAKSHQDRYWRACLSCSTSNLRGE